jgi:hypothetical protein
MKARPAHEKEFALRRVRIENPSGLAPFPAQAWRGGWGPVSRAGLKRNPFVHLASNHQIVNLPLTRGQRSNKCEQQFKLALHLS